MSEISVEPDIELRCAKVVEVPKAAMQQLWRRMRYSAAARMSEEAPRRVDVATTDACKG